MTFGPVPAIAVGRPRDWADGRDLGMVDGFCVERHFAGSWHADRRTAGDCRIICRCQPAYEAGCSDRLFWKSEGGALTSVQKRAIAPKPVLGQDATRQPPGTLDRHVSWRRRPRSSQRDDRGPLASCEIGQNVILNIGRRSWTACGARRKLRAITQPRQRKPVGSGWDQLVTDPQRLIVDRPID